MTDTVKPGNGDKERPEDVRNLVRLCKRLDDLWYVAGDRAAAQALVKRLDNILNRLDQEKLDMAVVLKNALAWSHQLKGDFNLAVHFRLEELKLIKRLHAIVERDVASGAYDQDLADYALAGYQSDDLQRKQDQVKSLQEEMNKGYRFSNN